MVLVVVLGPAIQRFGRGYCCRVVVPVSDSPRLGRPLPKWPVVGLAVAGVAIGFVLLMALTGTMVGLAAHEPGS